MAVLIGVALAGTGCSSSTDADGGATTAVSAEPTVAQPPIPSTQPKTPSPAPSDDFRPRTAWATVQHLAGVIGPRQATGRAYVRAARWVTARFTSLGYDTRQQGFAVPAGVSWGVPVQGGRSVNVIATPPDFHQDEPHLVLGAHLDTVPQAPGAEDNASGVGVLLATAEAVARRSTRLPVVFIAFGAEEPRGPTDDDHHYGSRWYVTHLTGPERNAMRGMLALDRVGVGTVLPVCSADDGRDRIRTEVLRAAHRAGVRTQVCDFNRASDHWSFVRNGLPGARLGSTPFAGYHSPGDVPAVIEMAQLRRAGWTAVAWITGR